MFSKKKRFSTILSFILVICFIFPLTVQAVGSGAESADVGGEFSPLYDEVNLPNLNNTGTGYQLVRK